MTAIAEAFALARRNTKSERRTLRAKPKVSKPVGWPDFQWLDLGHAPPRDAGMDLPPAHQARPNSKLCVPGPGKRRKVWGEL